MILFDQTWLGALIRVVLTIAVVFGGFVFILVWGERKISAFIQDRLGPNRIGPFGLFQGIADAIKFLFKEDYTPAGAHKLLFSAAPFAAVFPAIMALAIVPYGARRIDGILTALMIANLDVGVLFALSVSSLGVFSIILGGWASNSKYPFLGSLRAAAQMISYEIPLGMTILSVVVLAGTTKLPEIIGLQSHTWFIFLCPIGFLLFMVSMFAETNRLPFDMPEGESEIIGYHAEYSSFRFAMFFMAEYVNMVTVSALCTCLFLGGWEFLPFFGWEDVGRMIGQDIFADSTMWLIPTIWFALKLLTLLFVFIWVRWTLPRFRYDQLMNLGWKKLIPISLANFLLMAFIAAQGV